MCTVFQASPKQVTFILALEVGQIDPGSTAGAALCNTSFGQDKSGIRWTYRHSIVHDWLYLPCPRGASHPVSLTCATYWHFLYHPQVLACALASRQHSKFIIVRLVRKLLQTNGASGSRLTSSTMRNGFGVFRIVRKHMNSGPLHLLLRGPLQCQFWDGGVCCSNCLTALNETSIFQDFTRSSD